MTNWSRCWLLHATRFASPGPDPYDEMSLNIEQTRSLVTRALEDLAARRDELNDLDRGLGDGDHGTTIARGAKAAIDALR